MFRIPFFRIFSLIISSVPFASLSAPPPPEWAKIVGQSVPGRPITCYDVATDPQNNIYIATGPNFGLGHYSPTGEFLNRSGIALNDFSRIYEVLSVIITSDGSVKIAGNSWESGVFAAFFTGGAGNVRNGYAVRRPIAVNPAGNSLFGVSFSQDISYAGVNYSSTGSSDSIVFHAGSNGEWARRITGEFNEYVESLALTADGGVLVSFGTDSSSAGIAGLSLTGGARYLVSLDAFGNANWSKTLSSDKLPIGNQKGRSIITYHQPTDTLLWAADFTGAVNFGTSLSSSGGTDVVLARFSKSGAPIWAKKAGGGSGSQFANSVVIDQFENIYVTGYFTGQLSIGSSNFASHGLEDLYVAKFDKNGNPLWALQIGSPGSDMESGLALTTNHELVVAGTIAGGVRIGNIFIEGAGPTDAFIARFKSEGLPPAFVTHPTGGLMTGGANLRLSAEVESVLPVTYQWFFNGAALQGQTSATLTIPSATPAVAGTYFVVARSPAGEVRSQTAAISYTDAAGLTLEMRPTLTIFGTVGQTYRIDGADVTSNAITWTTLTNLTLERTPVPWVDLSSRTDQRIYRAVLQP